MLPGSSFICQLLGEKPRSLFVFLYIIKSEHVYHGNGKGREEDMPPAPVSAASPLI